MISAFNQFRLDYEAFTQNFDRASVLRLATKTIIEPGLTFTLLARIQIAFEQRGLFPAARLLHLVNLRLTGGEVGHGCRIGSGLVVKHPLGIVIGGGTQIGDRCTILRNVTFGELRPDNGQPVHPAIYPTIGSDCMIGTGATVLGGVIVGDRVRIGAHALVLSNIPAGVTAVGIPAKPVRENNRA